MAKIPGAPDRLLPRDRSRVVSIDTRSVGAGLSSLGASLDNVVEQRVQEDAELEVNEYRRKVNEWEQATIYDPENGAASRRGKDAFDLPKTIGESFDKFNQTAAGSATSPRARQAIARIAAARREQHTEWAGRYAGQQRELYIDGQYALDNQSGAQRAATLASDPTVVEGELLALRGRAVKQAQRRFGATADADTITKFVTAEEQTFHAGVMSSLIAHKDYAKAATYFGNKAKLMGTDDQLRFHQELDRMNRDNLLLSGTREIVDGVDAAAQFQPTQDFKTIFTKLAPITEQIESGGRDYDDAGNVLTSPKGARGRMQVMPATAANPGYGITPARDDSIEEYARVGNEYLNAMVSEFKGDPRRIMAAYNAGPGAVQDAVLRSQKEGGDWLSYLPKETQDYVAKADKLLGQQMNQPKGRRIVPLSEIEPAIRAKFTDPTEYSRALALASQQLTTRNEGIRVDRETAAEEATALLDQGFPFEAISPALYNRLDPNVLGGLRDYAKRRAEGKDVQTDMDYYYDLVTDPKRLLNENLRANFYRLGEQHRNSLISAQVSLREERIKPRSILSRKEIAEGMYKSTYPDVDLTSKSGKAKVAALMYDLSGMVDDKTTDADYEIAVARRLTEIKLRNRILPDTSKPAFEVTPEDLNRIEVPPAARKRILAWLDTPEGKAYGADRSDAAIKKLYLRDLRAPIVE